MEWISVKNQLPTISYLESDNEEDPYECVPVLVYSEENPGIFCVAYLTKNQDENDCNFEELTWELYIPGKCFYGADIIERSLETFTHWMPLPAPPKDK